jgi:hypothetical protein
MGIVPEVKGFYWLNDIAKPSTEGCVSDLRALAVGTHSDQHL